MYIAGGLAVGCESRDVYRWCARSRMRVQRCTSLVRPLQDASPEVYITSVPIASPEMYIASVPTASPEMYIAGVPTVRCESRDVYRWCARCRMQVQRCILLVCPLLDLSPGMYIASAPAVGCESKNVSLEMYIAGAPTIGYESKDVYRWCAHYRMQVQRCISLVRPLQDVSPGMYIAGTPIVECKSRDVYRWCTCCGM